ncbi:MAG: hypothetical protein GY702_28865, partial [Desulfobulbaceae bacterium]|nr:hypothetical protein [Desulfobulbaceae bacterium]
MIPQIRNESGFLLVITMVILVILTLIGVAAIRSSRIELQIAGNDRLHKITFYEADGGTEVGGLLLEENINCPNGFFDGSSAPQTINTVEVTSNLKFWDNEDEPTVDYPSDTMRHLKFPNTAIDANRDPHTNVYFHGNSSLSTGNAIQMIAGYEGTGFGAAQGGGQLVTNISSQHIGVGNSLSSVQINWRHVI